MRQANMTSGPWSATSAVRVDDDLGIREHAEFLGSNERLFGFRHVPDRPIRGAVLVCGSLFAEFRKNYRKEVELGRRLASDGVAVQRFHYRGVGHSDGEPARVTFDSLTDDALAAAARLQEATGRGVDAVVGTRLGGLVAIGLASRLSAAAVLWEPVTDPHAYFREAFRARSIVDLAAATDTAGRRSHEEEMRSNGSVRVLGFPIHRALYESLLEVGRDVASVGTPSPVLVIRVRPNSVNPRRDELVDRWRHAGAQVDVREVVSEGAWWLAGHEVRSSDGPLEAADVVGLTAEWLEGIIGDAP